MIAKQDRSLMLVVRGSNEWELMWAVLAAMPENCELSAPTVAENAGQMWEYMETTKSRFLKKYHHRFRHRMHPVKGADYRVNIPASRDFSSDDYFINEW
ncbi:TPA: hypothetical protein JEM16_004475 [Salmonella enterica subsp. enterica serovar Senftenberg]|nr:hypothetical protein [Salmonella enterica subsp. enterica serovar Senftenberg]